MRNELMQTATWCSPWGNVTASFTFLHSAFSLVGGMSWCRKSLAKKSSSNTMHWLWKRNKGSTRGELWRRTCERTLSRRPRPDRFALPVWKEEPLASGPWVPSWQEEGHGWTAHHTRGLLHGRGRLGRDCAAVGSRTTGEDRLWESKFYMPFQPLKWASNKSNSSVTSSCASCGFLRSRLESQSWNSFNPFPIVNRVSAGAPTPPDSGKTPQLKTSKLAQNCGKMEVLHLQPSYGICWRHEIETLPPM